MRGCTTMSDSHTNGSNHLAGLSLRPRTVTELFAIVASATYASGFLVMTVFMDRFGITAPGDFLRIRYLQVGILFFLFPAIVIVPIFLYFSLRLQAHSALQPHPVRLITPIFILSNVLLISYVFATFANPSYFYRHEWPIAVLYVWTLFGMTTARRLASRGHSTGVVALDAIIAKHIDPIFDLCRLSEFFRVIAVQVTFVVVAIAIDCWLLDWTPVKSIMALNLFKRSFFYYFLSILGSFVFVERYVAIQVRYEGRDRVLAWFFTLCLLAGLWYMSVYAFAYGIFPDIPVLKGGGNYATARSVEIYFKKDACSDIPAAIISRPPNADPCAAVRGEAVKSIPLKIIEQTAEFVFVADPNVSNPQQWRLWKTPTIYAVYREQIAGTRVQTH